MRKRERALGRGFRNFEQFGGKVACHLPLPRMHVYIDSIEFDMLSVREEALCVRQGLSVPVKRS
jgi:hypothetical protein